MAIPAWQQAAKEKAAAMTRSAGGKFAKKAAASGAGAGGLMSLLKAGKYGSALKTPTGMIGGYFVLSMLFNRIMKHYTETKQLGGQERLIESQMQASPEDAYYQAMLPQLTEERQGAQNALLQAILGGSGQMPQVPGERTIGGG